MKHSDEKSDFRLPEAFRLQISSVDAEHEELISDLNQLKHDFDGTSVPLFESRFHLFIEKLKQHFEHEEVLMAECAYPGLGWHQQHHDKTMLHTKDMLANCVKRGYANDLDLARFFNDIIIDVARADMKFSEYLSANR